MRKRNQVKVFGCENDTNKWAVVVDGYFGLFPTKAEATSVYQGIGGSEGDDGLAETAFGTAQLLPPGYKPAYTHGYTPEGGIDRLSGHRPIDILGYIRMKPLRVQLGYQARTQPLQTPSQRLEQRRFERDFFGGEVPPLSERQEEIVREIERTQRNKAITFYREQRQRRKGKQGTHCRLSRAN